MSFFRSETIEARLKASGGITNGFDYMRLMLAFFVLCFHTIDVLGGTSRWFWWTPLRPLPYWILPSFFALSGFLVCGSLMRVRDLTTFMTYRAVRILPALTVEVMLSALLLGPLLTTLSWHSYFSHPEFWSYFLNILGDIHMELPGVFKETKTQLVNVSLWTIPYELWSYIALFSLAVTGLVRNRVIMLVLVVLAMIFLTLGLPHPSDPLALLRESGLTGPPPPGLPLDLLSRFATRDTVEPPGRLLVLAFLLGVLSYQWRDRILLSWPVFLVMLVAMFWFNRIETFIFMFFATIPVVYVTMFLGTLHPPKKTFLMEGDYSYGFYLFAFPVQQTLAYLFPALRHWWLIIPVATVVTLGFAWLSWNFIEKPVLGRKKEIARWMGRGVSGVRQFLTAI